MALPVCCKEVGTESLINEVAKWNKFNFDCYSLLTSTKLDSRTAVLWTKLCVWQCGSFIFCDILLLTGWKL